MINSIYNLDMEIVERVESLQFCYVTTILHIDLCNSNPRYPRSKIGLGFMLIVTTTGLGKKGKKLGIGTLTIDLWALPPFFNM